MKAPSDFCKYPWDSIMQKTEAEIVACNIMVILKRTGNKFRYLSYEEYELERMKDGNYSGLERQYFDKVIKYCQNCETARSFSPNWY